MYFCDLSVFIRCQICIHILGEFVLCLSVIYLYLFGVKFLSVSLVNLLIFIRCQCLLSGRSNLYPPASLVNLVVELISCFYFHFLVPLPSFWEVKFISGSLINLFGVFFSLFIGIYLVPVFTFLL